MVERRALVVPPLGAPARLDRWLAGVWTDLSRSRLQALIEAGAITVAGKKVRAKELVAGGETVTAAIPAPVPLAVAPEARALDIVYQDKDVAVINKPAGLTVHPSATQHSGTLVNALLAALPDLSGISGTLRPGIVHRLDKDTSGLIIVAKNDAAHHALAEAFAKRQVSKHYIAFVSGAPPLGGEWAQPIGRHPNDRKRFSTRSLSGKPALSRFKRLAAYPGAAKLDIELFTGRTHQIRVHAQNAGFPLIGDKVYARNARMPKVARDFPRQALHAFELTLTLPNGKQRTFRAPLPEDLVALEKKLAE